MKVFLAYWCQIYIFVAFKLRAFAALLYGNITEYCGEFKWQRVPYDVVLLLVLALFLMIWK